MDNMTEYEKYRQRWLAVPGDHAPGRLLDFDRWQAFSLELAELMPTADKQGHAKDKRATQLRRALLLDRDS